MHASKQYYHVMWTDSFWCEQNGVMPFYTTCTYFYEQALDTSEAERSWIIQHLGHNMDVHLHHYRQTSDVLERTEVAKISLIQDFGIVPQYVGRKLSDIQLDGKLF